MKVIYIASPYTVGDVARNVAIQIDAAHAILDMGHCPVAPLLSHFLHLYRQRPYEDWTAMDDALLVKCDLVLRLPGQSDGADREVQLAAKTGIPVAIGWKELYPMLERPVEYETVDCL